MATEAPNTLRSRAKYHVIDILSEAPLKGLAEGLKSIYLDGTPIMSDSGALNFKNFKKESDLITLPRAYLPDQTEEIRSGFSTSLASESVNVKVTKDSPEGSGSGDGSVSRTIEDADLDAIRVTLRLPSLFYNDLATGNTLGTDLRFKISVASSGGSAVAINNSSAWSTWNTEDEETPDGTRGLSVKCQLTQSALQFKLSKLALFQYAKKDGESWGNWTTFQTFSFPSVSPSASPAQYWNPIYWLNGTIKNLEGTVSGLTPGIYKVRIATTNCTATIVSQEQFGALSSTISGKCVAPYDASYLVPLPAGGAPWTVTVERITDDRVASNYSDDLYWLSYTEILYEKFSWPYLAGYELTFDAEDFDSVPERAYDVFGMIISVPANYDPYARTYTGVWDGTFKEEWTDNPAWILYDLISKKRYGLGDDIPASYLETLKWTLYSIAQYCDEEVTVDGDFVEPRYTCSICINSQQEAYDLLNTIVSTFRGMLYPAGDGLVAVADRLTDPVINIGPANVIDGMFTYQGPARKTIHTAAYVTWNNPDDGYRLNTALYENREGIRQYGYRIDKINAIGACSKSLALRLAKWKILTEVMAPDTVTYRASFDHLNVMPGDIINISDPAYTSEELVGRIKSIAVDEDDETTTFELDRSVVRIGNDESLLELTLPDQTILSLDVSVVSTTTGDEITVPTADVTTTPNVGAIWLLSKETVRPRMWRIFHIAEAEPNIYEVSASLVEPTKWDLIEGGWNFEPADYTGFPSGEMPPPTGLYHSEFLKPSGSSIICCVNLSWSRPSDARAAFFRAEYRKDTQPWKSTEPVLCQNPSIDIFDIEPGTYDFRVQAVDGTGLIKSEWTYRAGETILGKTKKPENVTNFTAVIEKYGVLMNWSPVSDRDINYYEIRRGASWTAGTFVGRAKGTTFKWEDATAAAYTFWIKAFDTQNPPNESVAASTVSVEVVVEATPTVTSIAVIGGIEVAIAGTVTNRFAHYELQRKKTTEKDAEALTIVGILGARKHTDNYVATVGYSPLWQYRARAFNKNLNESLWSTWSVGIAPLQISGSDMVMGAISNSNLFATGVVDAAAIAAKAITEAKLDDLAVTNGKVAAGAISELKLANDAVTAAKLNVAGIDGTTGAVAAGAVAELQLASNAVTEAKIAAAAVNTAQINNAALKAPLGAVASWSAKNCTTASIALAGGVRDVSGQGNHGQAINGVVVSNTDLGAAFAISSTRYIVAPGAGLTANDRTFSVWFRKTVDEVRYIQILAQNSAYNSGTGTGIVGLWSNSTGYINIAITDGTSVNAQLLNFIPAANVWCHIVGVIKGNSSLEIYANGVLNGSREITINPLTDERSVFISGWSTPSFDIAYPKIYNRALSASEVKSLYMFPEDAAFGNVTADLLTTGELITGTAQIKDAIITNAKISTLDAAKINTGYLAAARIAAETITSAMLTTGELITLSAQIKDAIITNAKISTLDAAKINTGYLAAARIAAGTITSAMVTTGELITLTAQIKDAIITDAKISTLDAAKINTGYLVADRIAAGSIVGAKIAAGTITTSNLLIAAPGAALNDDPCFADPTAWITHAGTNVFATVTDGKVGNTVLRSPTASSSYPFSAKKLPLDPSKTYRVRAWVRKSSTSNGVLYMCWQTYNSAGVKIPANEGYYAVSGVTPGTTWTEYSVLVGAGTSWPATSDARTMSIGFLLNYGATAGYAEAQDFRIEECLPATLIQDGAIITDKLAASAITAAKLSAGCVETAALAAGAITAEKIYAGAVTAAKLATDAIKSTNYSTTAGSFFDLSAGDVKMGGSSAPRFSFTNSTNTGVFAGFTFNATDLTAGSSTTAIGISTDTAKRAFWAGSATSTSAPFNVTHGGAMTATSGHVGGFNIVTDYLQGVQYTDANNYAYNYIYGGANSKDGILLTSRTSGVSVSAVRVRTSSGVDLYAAPVYAEMADSTKYGVSTTGSMYAAGGYYPTSDERAKSDIVDVSVLESLKSVRVKKYHLDDVKIQNLKREKEIAENLKNNNSAISETPFSNEPEIENYNPCKSIGVIAQDFNKAFGIGHNDPTTYNLTDAIGVALRAIQELAEIVDAQKTEIAELRAALNLPEKKVEIEINITDEEIAQTLDKHLAPAATELIKELKSKRK